MQIDRILYPITSLGPGKRIGIWTLGCLKKCPKCANPELRSFDKSKDLPIKSLDAIISFIDFSIIDGITISGGEPFCQSEDLLELLVLLYRKKKDILVFTGYTFDELNFSDNPYIRECFRYIGVLVTGEYIDELNDNHTPLLASTNQEIIFLKQNLRPLYGEYQKKGRQIQNIFHNNEMMSVGIHNREENMGK